MKNNKITLGYSPCPNDTFIFDALIHQRIDTEGLEVEVVLGDVEELNQRAFRGDLDVTKLSFHAFAHCTDHYQLLDSGSALGNNCGPLLIAREAMPAKAATVDPLSIAIPGKYTTANFLLHLAFPGAQHRKEVLFSDIEAQVVNQEVDAGLIIHENRFTYAAKGLKKLIDLGEFWETETGSPIPLGGIVVKRELPGGLKQKVNRLIRKSVEYAFEHPKDSLPYIREHAQEMDEAVMYAHIDLYVNRFSVDLGPEGKKAVRTLFDRAQKLGIVPEIHPQYLLNS